jgi:hypothetical protein
MLEITMFDSDLLTDDTIGKAVVDLRDDANGLNLLTLPPQRDSNSNSTSCDTTVQMLGPLILPKVDLLLPSSEINYAMNGFNAGTGALLGGVCSGITGLVRKPFEGARSNGVLGGMRGFGEGLVGAVYKPVKGTAVGVASIATGAGRQVQKGVQNVSQKWTANGKASGKASGSGFGNLFFLDETKKQMGWHRDSQGSTETGESLTTEDGAGAANSAEQGARSAIQTEVQADVHIELSLQVFDH